METTTEKEPIKVFMPRKEYDELSAERIHEVQEETGCILVPIENEELQQRQAEPLMFYVPPTTLPEILLRDNSSPLFGKGHSTPYIEPQNYRKKQKAKRRQQKKARKNHK